MKIIKRHKNRKLYGNGQYLTLSDIELMTLRGEKFKVIPIDDEKNDLTGLIQSRIIARISQLNSREYLRNYLKILGYL